MASTSISLNSHFSLNTRKWLHSISGINALECYLTHFLPIWQTKNKEETLYLGSSFDDSMEDQREKVHQKKAKKRPARI